jgi:hypothetical protein
MLKHDENKRTSENVLFFFSPNVFLVKKRGTFLNVRCICFLCAGPIVKISDKIKDMANGSVSFFFFVYKSLYIKEGIFV